MDKQAARKIVEDALEKPFDKEKFTYLIKNVLHNMSEEKSFALSGNLIFHAFSDSVGKLERIGKYEDHTGRTVDVLIVHLKKETSLERARTMQRNYIAKYLNGSRDGQLKDAALVAFVAPTGKDWRFSFVKMDYRFNEEGKIKEDLTPARRFSFLVGEHENSHTAQSQLLPLLMDDKGEPDLDKLEDAFSIERVTKEFFEKYRNLFLHLKDSLDVIIEKYADAKGEFTAKNIDTGDFAKKLLGQIVFLYFLQKKGWFGVKRGEEWGAGSKRFLRELFDKKHSDYNNFFNDILEPLFYEALRAERGGVDDYYSRFDCRIPFLNGGLFDPIGDYDWVKTEILLPNELFSNSRETKEGDKGDGILDIFDRYNFTVKEDEPLEKEVAIDPEMLGKVFENLLEVKDRKSKGTYYTPREIVHYMCQESLIGYLATEIEGEVAREDIERLIRYGEAVVENESHVADIGHETSAYPSKLPESIRSSTAQIDEKLASIRVCDPAVGSGAFIVGMMNEIVRARGALTPYIQKNGERTAYDFKRHAIRECLYGVDIDASAVDIAKLRLWLSLVVDEEKRETIQPLPNLDYKIVQGNSLLSVEKNVFNHHLFKRLEELKSLYFIETGAGKKRDYKEEIDEIIGEITGGGSEFNFSAYFSEVLNKKLGFDVVIANPPYDVIKDSNLRQIYANSIYGRVNTYGLFLHKSVQTLARPNALVTYINPKTLLADKYFINLRKFLKSNGNFKTILKIADRHKVFDNVLQAVIVHIFQRQENHDPQDAVLIHEIRERSDIENIKRRLAVESKHVWMQDRFGRGLLVSDKREVYSIFDKVINKTKPFLQLGIQFSTGKIQWDLFKDKLTDKPVPGSSRLIWAENVQRYRFGNSIKRKGKEFVNASSTVQAHITTKTIITQRTTSDEQERRIIATIFNPQQEGFNAFSENHTNFLARCEKSFEIEFVLGLVNSRFFDLIFRHINSNTQVSSGELNSLPIKDFPPSEQLPIVNLVDAILAITKDDDYSDNSTKPTQVREYERQIDELVYQLYGLTTEEIRMVEGEG